jgi:hypothetical protein
VKGALDVYPVLLGKLYFDFESKSRFLRISRLPAPHRGGYVDALALWGKHIVVELVFHRASFLQGLDYLH